MTAKAPRHPFLRWLSVASFYTSFAISEISLSICSSECVAKIATRSAPPAGVLE